MIFTNRLVKNTLKITNALVKIMVKINSVLVIFLNIEIKKA